MMKKFKEKMKIGRERKGQSLCGRNKIGWSNYITITARKLATARVSVAERQRHLRISAYICVRSCCTTYVYIHYFRLTHKCTYKTQYLNGLNYTMSYSMDATDKVVVLSAEEIPWTPYSWYTISVIWETQGS